MTTRRGFFGLAAGAAASAPGIARTVASGMADPGTALTGGRSLANRTSKHAAGICNSGPLPDGLTRGAQIALIRSNPDLMAALLEKSKDRVGPLNKIIVTDSDLVTNRSLSLAAKRLIQYERDVKRDFEQRLSEGEGWPDILSRFGVYL